MIYDFRIYRPYAGKEEALKQRFITHVLPAFKRNGIEVVNVFAPNDDSGALWYITRFPDEEARQRGWDAFKNDQKWLEAKVKSEVGGPLLREQQITLLSAVTFNIG